MTEAMSLYDSKVCTKHATATPSNARGIPVHRAAYTIYNASQTARETVRERRVLRSPRRRHQRRIAHPLIVPAAL